MAISATTVWESRAGAGSASNGGGFDPSLGGTDYSQQNSAQATGTVTSASTTVTATTNIFTSVMVGNIISDGTTYVQITAFTSATIVTVDSAPSWTAATVNVGGATSSILNICTKVVPGNKVWLKNTGTDTIPSFTGLVFASGTESNRIFVIGYNNTRGDLNDSNLGGTYASTHTADGFLNVSNFPTIILPSTSQLSFGNSTTFSSVNISSSGSNTIACNAFGSVFDRLRIVSTGASGSQVFFTSLSTVISDCDILHTGSSGTVAVNLAQTGIVLNCRIRSINGNALKTANDTTITDCVFYGLTTAQTAIVISGADFVTAVKNCTFNGILGTCVTAPAISQDPQNCLLVQNNQITNCGTFCSNLQSSTQRIAIKGGNNRIRNTTTPYTGFNNVADTTGFLPGDITTAQTDAAEYVNASAMPPNLNLLITSAGYQTGAPAYISTGALQPKNSSGGGAFAGMNGGMVGG